MCACGGRKESGCFPALDLPGTKAVVGDGPARRSFRHAFPERIPERISSARCGTRGLPLLTRSADVFVFPGSADTFGLVLLEELASGLPVTANPIVRPLDVIEIAALACLTRFSGEPRSQPSQFSASLRVPVRLR